MRGWVAIGAAGLMAAALSGCGNPAATPDSESAATQTASAGGRNRDGGERRYARGDRSPRGERAQASATLPGGGRWAASRSRSAEASARRQFERNGRDFAAADVNAYVRLATDFVTDPPAGVLTANRRNGDRLLYDPAQNIFAVATRDGAPRTYFKPREGMAYWREQEQRIASGGERRSRSGEQARATDASSENG